MESKETRVERKLCNGIEDYANILSHIYLLELGEQEELDARIGCWDLAQKLTPIMKSVVRTWLLCMVGPLHKSQCMRYVFTITVSRDGIEASKRDPA